MTLVQKPDLIFMTEPDMEPQNKGEKIFDFLDEIYQKENEPEDELLTTQYFYITRTDELISCLLIILSVISAIIYNEIEFSKDRETERFRNLALVFVSISTFSTLVFFVVKYYHLYCFYKYAQYIPYHENFFNSYTVVYFLIEFAIIFLHPNMLFRDKYFSTNEKWDLMSVEYSVNDILLLFHLIKFLYPIRLIVIFSRFYSPRSDRISKMLGKKLSFTFAFRALMISNPIIIILITLVIVTLMFSYMLKVIEGRAKLEAVNYYENFSDCIWNVLITMTTVGYGDNFPKTTLGKIVCVCVSVTGSILTAFIVNFLNSLSEITGEEKNLWEFIERLNLKDVIKKYAARYFKSKFLYNNLKARIKKGEVAFNDDAKSKLEDLLKNYIERKKVFRKTLHKYQLSYKMLSDLEKIKDKITEVEEYVDDTNSKIKSVFEKIYRHKEKNQV